MMITRNTCVADFLIEGINRLHDCIKPGTGAQELFSQCVKNIIFGTRGLPMKNHENGNICCVNKTHLSPSYIHLWVPCPHSIGHIWNLKWSVLTPLQCKVYMIYIANFVKKCKHRHNQNQAIYSYQFFNRFSQWMWWTLYEI